MKKFISVLLCVAVVFTSLFMVAYADDDDLKYIGEVSEYPVVIVAGYSSSPLYYGDDFQTGKLVWTLDWDSIASDMLNRIAEIGIGIGHFMEGDAEYIAKVLYDEMDDYFEYLRCNPDGTSKYEIHPYFESADMSSREDVMENFDGDYSSMRLENEVCEGIEEYIPRDDIYNFYVDWRMGAEYCATRLDEYIQDVKQHTGKDKVNIFGTSHGGQVTATYLALFGYKQDVDNVVMSVPAIAGAGIALDLMSENVHFNEEELVRFVEHGMMFEENYNWLLKAQQLGFLDKLLNELCGYAFELLGYWQSLWDFIPVENYEEIKAKWLTEENAELIKKCDRFHYEILPTFAEKFNECREKYGMNVSITAGYGVDVVSGWQVQSDAIIPTHLSTGATCAPYGQRFADGYTQALPLDGKNKISPDRLVDASTAYLPDQTWFINSYFHGMHFKDEYTKYLVLTLLLTDTLTDVYSSAEYPQFRYCSNPASSVYAEFVGCEDGYINSDSKSLKITNVCENSTVTVTAVWADGIDIVMKLDSFVKLQPGESVEIPFVGELPEVSGKAFNLNIDYVMNTYTPFDYRTMTFTVDNGAPVIFDGDEIFVPANSVTPIENMGNGNVGTLLEKLGLREYCLMIFTFVMQWVGRALLIIK